MIQQNMAVTPSGQRMMSGTVSGSKTITLQSVIAQLTLIGATGGENGQLANQLLAQLGGGDSVSPALLQSLSVILQSSDGDALSAGLSKLLAQFGQGAGENTAAVKALGNLLTRQIVDSPSLQGGQVTSLLRQLSRGNIGEQTTRQLQQVLQQLRESGSPVRSQVVGEQLQSVLRQVQQELGQSKEAMLAKPLAEFAVRLNQQVSDDAALQQSARYRVHERQEQNQQGQQQRSRQQWEDDTPVELSAATGKKKISLALSPESETAGVAAKSGYQASSLIDITVSGNEKTPSGSSVGSLLNGDSVFSYGLSVLYLFMQMLSDQANSRYADMESNSTTAREAQGYASQVDSVLADVSSSDDKNKTATLSKEVIQYIEDNHLEIDGVCGYGSDGKWAWQTTPSGGFKKGDLTAIKGALDNVANRASDFISTAQLQLQKLMQTYNVCSSLINSMQTLLADMNKTIAQGIR